MVRSTRKCPANIAESFGRFNWPENIQFNRISRASLTEFQDHLKVAEECGYIDKQKRDKLKVYIQITKRLINGFIKFLEGQKVNSKNHELLIFTKYQVPSTKYQVPSTK